MEEDMMLPNVAPAPKMAGTPMGGDLSEPMAPAQAELDPAEMQEAQGALMQIIQIIQMLVNQGMSEEEIQQFLAQYGITEEELDQAAAILGVDIDALIAGEQRMPMAEGGSSVNYMDIYNRYKDMDFTSIDDIAKPGTPEDYDSKMFKLSRAIMISDSDYKKDLELGLTDSAAERLVFIESMKKELQTLKNEYDKLFNPRSKKQNMIPPMMMAASGMPDPLAPAPVPRTPDMMIFSINSDINNLMQEYNMAVRNNEFERAQGIADQIDGLQQQIINLQESKVPPMEGLNMRFGGSAAGK